MAVFNPGDKFRLENAATGKRLPGTFSAQAAKARAIARHVETGESIDVFIVGGHGAIAGAAGGQWSLYQPHDEEGNSLQSEPYPGDDAGDG